MWLYWPLLYSFDIPPFKGDYQHTQNQAMGIDVGQLVGNMSTFQGQLTNVYRH
jgi:hypothetical protein